MAQPAGQKPAARAAGSWLWTGAAAALAAGLAIAAMLLPKREPVRQVGVPPPAQRVEEQIAVKEIPAVTPQPRVTNASTAPKARRPHGSDPFIALDDEPIESGIVMRVELPGSTPADIVFSPDGRARAVRLVNGNQRNY